MIKSFAIDFVRQIIVQTLELEHFKEPTKYIGGDNELNLFSFYEQLSERDNIDRYVEMYRDLCDQQNRTGLIANGTIVSQENPTITNLKKHTIIPLTFTCTFRTTLANRDKMVETINHLIELRKGRKVDVAEFDNGKLFCVGTLGSELYSGLPCVSNLETLNFGGLLGDSANISSKVADVLSAFNSMFGNANVRGGFSDSPHTADSDLDKFLYVCYKTRSTALQPAKDRLCLIANFGSEQHPWIHYDSEEDISSSNGLYSILIPPEHDTYTRWKVSISFDTIRVDEPRTLNADEYCVISFGGSATIVSENVALGNDMLWVILNKANIPNTPIELSSTPKAYEPLEMPSGTSADSMLDQVMSNNFVNKSHTNSINVSNQYTFILDKSDSLIKQWYLYSRYGKVANGSTLAYDNYITPNMVYDVNEYWCSWGNYEYNVCLAKINGSIDIENTEGDTLTITIPFQMQGGDEE